jgi:hypothetical protein
MDADSNNRFRLILVGGAKPIKPKVNLMRKDEHLIQTQAYPISFIITAIQWLLLLCGGILFMANVEFIYGIVLCLLGTTKYYHDHHCHVAAKYNALKKIKRKWVGRGYHVCSHFKSKISLMIIVGSLFQSAWAASCTFSDDTFGSFTVPLNGCQLTKMITVNGVMNVSGVEGESPLRELTAMGGTPTYALPIRHFHITTGNSLFLSYLKLMGGRVYSVYQDITGWYTGGTLFGSAAGKSFIPRVLTQTGNFAAKTLASPFKAVGTALGTAAGAVTDFTGLTTEASRAGVTITGARCLGVKRESAAILSMLLSIPIIFASLTLALFDINFLNNNSVNISQTFIAMFVAFITAILSIHMMMKILQFTNFNVFIIYRITLGIILLVFYA